MRMTSGLVASATRDAQSLLLAAGQVGSRLVQPILNLVPHADRPEHALDKLIGVAAIPDHASKIGAVGDVGADRPRKRIGLLRDPAEPLTQDRRVYVRCVDVGAIQQDATLHPGIGNHVIGAVQAAQQRGLAATGRADEGRHFIAVQIDRDILECLLLAIPEADMLDAQCNCVRDVVIGNGTEMDARVYGVHEAPCWLATCLPLSRGAGHPALRQVNRKPLPS